MLVPRIFIHHYMMYTLNALYLLVYIEGLELIELCVHGISAASMLLFVFSCVNRKPYANQSSKSINTIEWFMSIVMGSIVSRHTYDDSNIRINGCLHDEYQ